MTLELLPEEEQLVRQALEAYLRDLREELRRTEKHDWRVRLHAEEDLTRQVIARLGGVPV